MWGFSLTSRYLPYSVISLPRYSYTVQALWSYEIEAIGIKSMLSFISLGRGGLTLTTTLKFWLDDELLVEGLINEDWDILSYELSNLM